MPTSCNAIALYLFLWYYLLDMSLDDSLTPSVSLIVPAFNEEKRGLARTIENAHYGFSRQYGNDYEIIVADDGSEDLTAAIAESAGARVLRLDQNMGKGAAVRAGMLGSKAQFRAFEDADGSFQIDDVIRLLDRVMSDADIAIARRGEGSDMASPHASKLRALGSKAIGWTSKLIVPTGVEDTQCGAKAFRGFVADDIYGRAKIDGFAGDIEALYIARQLGYNVVSQVCNVTPMEGSKVRLIDGWKVLRDSVSIRISHGDLN